MKNTNPTVILGSSSPRRRELIQYLNFNVETMNPPFDESTIKEEDPKKAVVLIARGKTNSLLSKIKKEDLKEKILITSDTIVYIDKKIVGKPVDKTDAIKMLKNLSNRTHEVYTSVCFSYLGKKDEIVQKEMTSQTYVTFTDLNEDEIHRYTETKEPYDKAGSYGIQGPGSFMVKKIEGSYTNVMGLPLAEVAQEINSILEEV